MSNHFIVAGAPVEPCGDLYWSVIACIIPLSAPSRRQGHFCSLYCPLDGWAHALWAPIILLPLLLHHYGDEISGKIILLRIVNHPKRKTYITDKCFCTVLGDTKY